MIRIRELDKLKHVKIGRIPNMRDLIVPDPGWTIVDMDLDRADAQFVAWESGDEGLKNTLKQGLDLHLENAKALFPHAKWDRWDAKSPPADLKECRDLAKRFCHGANYGGWPKTLARAIGISVPACQILWDGWFRAKPGIKRWHNRVKLDLATTRQVVNPFGYPRYYFERPEDVLNKALAWVPQSSVAIVINTAMCNIMEDIPETECQVLMQVHDSLTMQVRTPLVRELLPEIEKRSLIPVPYPDPLTIPVGFKISTVSWGAVKEPEWLKAA